MLLLIVAVAASSCTHGATTTSSSDNAPVFNTAPRATSRASSLIIIGHATTPNRALVERAVAILRAHRELATQRAAEVKRLHLKLIEEIGVTACDSSCPPSDDILGTSVPDEGLAPGTVDCAVVLNMPLIRQSAKQWKTGAANMTALVLVHEQEHCLRLPDDERETPAVAAEMRLARKLHDQHLIAFVKDAMARLDSSGYWKQ